MTGMDVLRQCRRYDEDVKRLALRRQMAMEAATRITASANQGGSRSSGISDKAGRYARISMEIDKALSARETMYRMEITAAGELLGRLTVDAASVMYARMIQGLTVRQTAATLQKSESSVRGLYVRARTLMEDTKAGLGTQAAYRDAAKRYCENGGAPIERFVKLFGADSHQ